MRRTLPYPGSSESTQPQLRKKNPVNFKQPINMAGVQRMISYEYKRGAEDYRVVVRTHATGTSITVLLLAPHGTKHPVLWHADCLGMDVLPATDFKEVRI